MSAASGVPTSTTSQAHQWAEQICQSPFDQRAAAITHLTRLFFRRGQQLPCAEVEIGLKAWLDAEMWKFPAMASVVIAELGAIHRSPTRKERTLRTLGPELGGTVEKAMEDGNVGLLKGLAEFLTGTVLFDVILKKQLARYSTFPRYGQFRVAELRVLFTSEELHPKLLEARTLAIGKALEKSDEAAFCAFVASGPILFLCEVSLEHLAIRKRFIDKFQEYCRTGQTEVVELILSKTPQRPLAADVEGIFGELIQTATDLIRAVLQQHLDSIRPHRS